jgi:hypothetical protein
MRSLEVEHSSLPCPAFLAGARHRIGYSPEGPIGVNLMPHGGHFQLDADFSEGEWLGQCCELLRELRSLGHVMFIAHDRTEFEFLKALRNPGETVFFDAHWRAYLDAYTQCSMVVANRVHGAVCASGLGVPSLIMGNDTRAFIGEFIKLPVFHAGIDQISRVVSAASSLHLMRRDESERLLAFRDDVLRQYTFLFDQATTVAPDTVRRSSGPDLATAH